MKVIGREFLRREFRFIPAKGKVVNIYMETAKYPVCSKSPAMEKAVQAVKSLTPEALIPHSYATAYVVAWVMYQKYANSWWLMRPESKDRYKAELEQLNQLIRKRDALRNKELLQAIEHSNRSFEEIMDFLGTDDFQK